MAQWQVVAEGVSLRDLHSVVGDMELPKGAKVRIIMDTSVPWVFDIAGAELAFKPFIPDGLDLVDVWGEGQQGIVEMEADPAWLVATLAFIRAHWLAITIAGFALAIIISFIVVAVKMPVVLQVPFWLVVGAAAGIVGLTVLGTRQPGRRRT